MASPLVRSRSAQVRFGERMRFWRERAGLTQVQLAARLSYDNTLISRLESGQRPVSQRVARRADQLLEAGGELITLGLAVLAERRQFIVDDIEPAEPAGAASGDPTDAVAVPLPGDSRSRAQYPPLHALMVRVGPGRVRDSGLVCPIHADVHCVAEDLESALELSDDDGLTTVHGYLAWLAVHDKASTRLIDARTLVAPVERVARVVFDSAGRAGRARRNVLLHVAADYAAVAGQLRGSVGQPAAAMAWLQRGARWAAAAGNLAAMCRTLAEMSKLARIEGDDGSAARYAAAACVVDDDRPWTIVHGRLHQGRVCATRGDRDGFERHVTAARRLIGRLGRPGPRRGTVAGSRRRQRPPPCVRRRWVARPRRVHG